MPTSMPGARTSRIGSPGTPELAGNTLPKGITAYTARAAQKAAMGATKYSGRSTWAGVTSSLNKNLVPSAMGWPKPNSRIRVSGMPTRFGPRRSWTQAAIQRSTRTK